MRALAVVRRATGNEFGIDPDLPPDQRKKQVDILENWWKENRAGFAWPGLPQPKPAAGQPVRSGPQRDPWQIAVQQLGSAAGTEAQSAERTLRDGGKSAIPALIDGLSDPGAIVRRRAHDILKEVAKQDFRYDPRADEADRDKAIQAWRTWAEREGMIKPGAVDEAAGGEEGAVAPPAGNGK
jgi:hypothetical protein